MRFRFIIQPPLSPFLHLGAMDFHGYIINIGSIMFMQFRQGLGLVFSVATGEATTVTQNGEPFGIAGGSITVIRSLPTTRSCMFSLPHQFSF